MKSSIIWKLVITAIVLAWAVLSMTPFKSTPFEQYIETRATQKVDDFKKILDEAKKRVDPVHYKEDPNKSSTLFTALGEYAAANKLDLSQYFDVNVFDIKNIQKRNDVLLRELYRQSKSALKKGLDLEGGVSFTLEINPDELESDAFSRKGQLDDVLRVLDGRINGLGVTEPSIRIVGSNSVEVQMPGVSLKDNPEAVEALSKAAKLEFKEVYRNARPMSMDDLENCPKGYQLLGMDEEDDHGNLYQRPLYVKKRAEAFGDIIKKSYPHMDESGRYAVGMEFTSAGSKRFEQITRDILAEDAQYAGAAEPYQRKKLLAIVLDGKLMSAPQISSVISDRGTITGNFNQREAIELANALNNPLKVGLKRTSMNEVGPSMAETAQQASIFAAVVGAGLVFLFMLLYYRGMGIISIFTVVANIVIVLGVLASFGATITLPGIAALVLNVGMAVDANILIFERMREELRIGKSMQSALEAGYDKAFSTIVDANVTTLLAAVILWQLGTGPVKGFGVTLAVGILATLFCALVFGRALCDIVVGLGWFKNSFNFAVLKSLNFDFMARRRKAFITAWIIILIGITTAFVRGDKCLSIDFTGGETTTVSFAQKLDIDKITAISDPDTIGEVQAAYKKDIATGSEVLTIQTENGKRETVLETLQKMFPEAKLTYISSESIGAAVSSEITKNAFISLGISLIGILLYVALRFEIGFGVGAVVSLMHDVSMSVGAYLLLGAFGIGTGQFSAPMIAAVLMIVGYSINDKIVVFDRVREELPLNPTMSLYDVIRLSINRTMSRTIITSVTTFFAAGALFIFGTGIIRDFALIFLLGIVLGTASSIFLASPVFYYWHKGSRKSVEATEAEVKHDWQEEA